MCSVKLLLSSRFALTKNLLYIKNATKNNDTIDKDSIVVIIINAYE